MAPIQPAPFNSPAYRLMLVTALDGPNSLLEQVEAFLLAGGKLIQFRPKGIPRERMVIQAKRILELCNEFEATLIINDYVEVALETQAHGVHLGVMDTDPNIARERLGPDAIIGFTVHTPEEMHRAAQLPINYIGIGPYRFTHTKQNIPPPLAKEGLSKLVEEAQRLNLNLPLFAIGGIEDQHVREILSTGCHGVAVSAAIAATANPQFATAKFLERIISNTRKC